MRGLDKKDSERHQAMAVRAEHNHISEIVSGLWVYAVAVARSFIPTALKAGRVVNLVAPWKLLAFPVASMAKAAILALSVRLIALIPDKVVAIGCGACFSFHAPTIFKGSN